MTELTDDLAVDVEDVESFRARARTWIRANLGPATQGQLVGQG